MSGVLLHYLINLLLSFLGKLKVLEFFQEALHWFIFNFLLVWSLKLWFVLFLRELISEAWFIHFRFCVFFVRNYFILWLRFHRFRCLVQGLSFRWSDCWEYNISFKVSYTWLSMFCFVDLFFNIDRLDLCRLRAPWANLWLFPCRGHALKGR